MRRLGAEFPSAGKLGVVMSPGRPVACLAKPAKLTHGLESDSGRIEE